MSKVTCILDDRTKLKAVDALGSPNHIHQYTVRREQGGAFYVTFDTTRIFCTDDGLLEEMKLRLGKNEKYLLGVRFEK